MQAIPSPQAGSPSEAFDNIAEIFDETFENEITKRFREKIYYQIQSVIPPGSSVLDINCGTGIDALELARRGYDVTGLDIAPKMIARAKAKAERESVMGTRFLVCSFEQLAETTKGASDLVLSNFGGLNCIQKIAPVAQQIASVTKPGGYFLATVMPPICLWEIVSGLVRLNAHTAFRRLRRNTPATGFRGKSFTVYYHPLKKFLSTFSPWFESIRGVGFSIISPPPHGTKFRENWRPLSQWLEQSEDSIATLPLLRSVGDHYMVLLKRKTG
ncbi:MAG: class I SAM-dependent methyltransferase [Ignavibacteriales bacterium]|nr:class I SAM-dependent methyltransferase [Ignavibacteriales bacterium]